MSKKRYRRKNWKPMKTKDNNYTQGNKTKLMHGRNEVAYYRTIYKKLDNSLEKEQRVEKLEEARKGGKRR